MKDNTQANNKNGESKKAVSNSPENSQDSDMVESQDSQKTPDKSGDSPPQKEPLSPVDITAPPTSDGVRIKCRELLAGALKVDSKFNDSVLVLI